MPHVVQVDPVAQGLYLPFPLTVAMHASPVRFKVIDCGRQFGKTTFAMNELMKQLQAASIRQRTFARALVVSPTYKLLYENWRTLMAICKNQVSQANLAEMRVQFPYGEVEFRSADSEAGVGRGGRYHAVLFDEAARVPERVWQEEVRPAIAESRGSAVFISTPNGKNWFYRLWLMSQQFPEDYASWRYSTMEGWRSRHSEYPQHPADPKSLALAEQEWEKLKATVPERVFQQEYLATFLEHEGSLWTLGKSIRGSLSPAVPGRSYVAGVDVAHIEDWMVTLVMERESKQVVGLLRSKHHDWALQKAKAISLLTQYPQVHVLIDSTGLGDPIAQDLRREGLDIEDVSFTKRSKQEMVENLTVGLEQGYLGIPDQLETQWLLEELRSYQELPGTNGAVRYGAPPGLHDDGVTALMLAAWGLRHEMSMPNLSQLALRDLDSWTLDDAVRYGERMRRWEALYPDLSRPQHPNDLLWRMAQMDTN